MAKRASSKSSKTKARAAKPKTARPAKTAAPARRKQATSDTEKYEQVGAPWWKRHLPGL